MGGRCLLAISRKKGTALAFISSIGRAESKTALILLALY